MRLGHQAVELHLGRDERRLRRLKVLRDRHLGVTGAGGGEGAAVATDTGLAA